MCVNWPLKQLFSHSLVKVYRVYWNQIKSVFFSWKKDSQLSDTFRHGKKQVVMLKSLNNVKCSECKKFHCSPREWRQCRELVWRCHLLKQRRLRLRYIFVAITNYRFSWLSLEWSLQQSKATYSLGGSLRFKSLSWRQCRLSSCIQTARKNSTKNEARSADSPVSYAQIRLCFDRLVWYLLSVPNPQRAPLSPRISCYSRFPVSPSLSLPRYRFVSHRGDTRVHKSKARHSNTTISR